VLETTETHRSLKERKRQEERKWGRGTEGILGIERVRICTGHGVDKSMSGHIASTVAKHGAGDLM
jgi:hypothetical protein